MPFCTAVHTWTVVSRVIKASEEHPSYFKSSALKMDTADSSENAGYNPQYHTVSQTRGPQSERLVWRHNSDEVTRPTVFVNVTPSNAVEAYLFGRTGCLRHQERYPVMMKVTNSEKSTPMMKQFHLKLGHISTRLHDVNIPEVRSLHRHCSKNLSSSHDGGNEACLRRSTNEYCNLLLQRASRWQIPLLLFRTKQSL